MHASIAIRAVGACVLLGGLALVGVPVMRGQTDVPIPLIVFSIVLVAVGGTLLSATAMERAGKVLAGFLPAKWRGGP